MAQSAANTAQKSTENPPVTSVAQQGDNIAHALAGAGGGLLSMALTYLPTLLK